MISSTLGILDVPLSMTPPPLRLFVFQLRAGAPRIRAALTECVQSRPQDIRAHVRMTTQGTTVRQVSSSGLKVPGTIDVLWNLRQISHMTVYMAYQSIFLLKHSLLQCVYLRMQWKLFIYVVWSKRPCWVEIST